MKQYFVSPDGNGWVVQAPGGKRAVSRHDTKADAVDAGRGVARNQQASLVIQKRDGTIQEERTFGSDPFPPKG